MQTLIQRLEVQHPSANCFWMFDFNTDPYADCLCKKLQLKCVNNLKIGMIHFSEIGGLRRNSMHEFDYDQNQHLMSRVETDQKDHKIAQKIIKNQN